MSSNEYAVQLRNKIEHRVYIRGLKPLFFKRDPEVVHDQLGATGSFLGTNSITRGLTSLLFSYANPVLEQKIDGTDFTNPIGLAAGFDKNARLTSILPHVGFGWMEVGSITARPCAGNPKPRLYRLPKSQALVVNYGLMNDGCDALYVRMKHQQCTIPVGTSLAPTNDELTMDYHKAIDDYLYSYTKLANIGSYTTLNLSCPNTSNDQPFIDHSKLNELLEAIKAVKTDKPLYLKLSPDLTYGRLDTLLTVAQRHGVAGVICTNLTKDRDNPAIREKHIPIKGGISGKVVQRQSDQMIAHIAQEWRKAFTIVGCGGVSSAEDAYKKIGLGASLIQLVTGMIYEGPQLISEINQGLAAFLKRDGFTSINQAIGKDL